MGSPPKKVHHERPIKFKILFQCDNTFLEEVIHEDDWDKMSTVEKMQRLTSMVILTSQALKNIQSVVHKLRLKNQK